MIADLERAAIAVAGGDYAAALEDLLAAWRLVEADALVALIETVAERVRAEAPDEKGKRRHTRLFDLARGHRAVDLPMLLDELARAAPAQALDLIDAFAGWPRDPRLGPGLCAALARRVYSPATTARARRAFLLLDEQADPRTLQPLGALDFAAIYGARADQRLGEGTAGHAAATLDQLRAGVVTRLVARFPVAPKLSADATAVIARIRALLDDPTAERLFAALYADPDDDAARQVLADYLIERNDPRGELLSLQDPTRRPSAAAQRRAQKLIAAHGRAWLGRLAAAVDNATFARGFPVAVRVAKPAELAAVSGDAAWTTIESLDLDGMPSLPTALLVDPTLRRLRTLRGVSDTALVELCALTQALGLTELSAVSSRRDAPMRLADARSLPSLLRLTLASPAIDPDDWVDFWRRPLGQRLVALELAAPLDTLIPWLDALAKLPPNRPTITLRDGGLSVTCTHSLGGLTVELPPKIPAEPALVEAVQRLNGRIVNR